MHKALANALAFARTWVVSAGHEGVGGKHTAVPTAETRTPGCAFVLANIKAVAGGAGESTCSTCETGIGHFFPQIAFKEGGEFFGYPCHVNR